MEVIYKHCSVLIAIAEFNLKMYRNTAYQEEWQRRVCRRVDSLFVDLPILSPVTEESTDLTDKSPIPHDDGSNSSSRSNSPLPPLIIEILPNKHDEPEEYYVKLQKRMIKAYRRLLVENRSLSSGAYDSNSTGSCELDSLDYDERGFDGNVRDTENRSLSTIAYDSNSNGSSDLDSFAYEGKDLDGNDRDIENRTLSVRAYDSNSNGNSDIDSISFEARNLEGDVRDIENRSLSSGAHDSNYNGTIPMADYHDNDFNNDSYYSDEYEADFESIDTTIESLNGRGIEDAEMSRPDDEDSQSLAPTEIIDTEDLNHDFEQIERPSSVQHVFFQKDLHNARIDDDDVEMLHESSSNDLNESHERNDFEGIDADESRNETKTDLIEDDNEIELSQEDIEAQGCDENDLNDVEVPSDDKEEATLSSAGTDYRQITTIALVHVDGTKHQEDKESTVYEESVKSVILLTRPVVRTATRSEEMQVEFEDAARVEDNEDPPPTLPILYEESSIEEIEQMRSGHLNLSQESIPINFHRDSESLEPTAFIENPADLTSSSQNGAADRHSEFDISSDMHDILSYNFNESRKSSNSRKRKADLDSKSVQTSEVFTRDDFDGEIFLTGAKVFRLCSCKDHVCH